MIDVLWNAAFALVLVAGLIYPERMDSLVNVGVVGLLWYWLGRLSR